jgi:hypothetical protein
MIVTEVPVGATLGEILVMVVCASTAALNIASTIPKIKPVVLWRLID